MGGKQAPGKTVVLSTSAWVRRQLRLLRIPELGGKLDVKTDVRDLGSHIAFGGRPVSPTGTRRLGLATLCAKALAALRAPFQ
eukprot:6236457-Alexandrium_andersonii.AAC.1